MMISELGAQAAHVVAAGGKRIEKRLALIAVLREAEQLLMRGDSVSVDGAALALDGMIGELAREWLAERGVEAPAPGVALDEIERREGYGGEFGGRVRLALRAADAHARLAHCRELLRCINGADRGQKESPPRG